MSSEIRVKIRGIADYLQHKRPFEEETSRKRSGEADYSKEAEKAVYCDEEINCYIPSKHIRASLVKSAVNFKIKGRMRKTYKDMVNATVEVEPDKIPLGKETFDYTHQEFVKIKKDQILRSRPAFRKGWEAEFRLLILDEQMPKSVLKEILEYAGKFVGIGDWRPHFGRFEIVSFK